ncbi:MAG: sigma-70 family RNA polymerase sigma factor [Acidobacteria bacterium]|nr:MAG: sigma-70 family RNA polymerase sigma factor [Acidobacteriota bacterium]REK02603.1 MAG: sigma-70 family RNA polymerase sigma factor [Acidobacteriota bacterium]REK13594.1 MAG: sigma-70 family RNA polymerase sigma factor [Acidobacteriota bacterium]REK41588.1 MAG: sigma-70 family RNA polymerase sigma factor [Acidobacteriota bacterium]
MSESRISRQLLILHGNDADQVEASCGRSTPEAALVHRALNGKQDAYDDLYRRYFPMVHGIVLARAPSCEADDLVQEVFIAAFKKLHTLNDPDAVGGWIASIARRRIVDSHRGKRKEEEITENLASPDRPSNEAYEVLCAIKSLPEAYCETLILRLVEGMTGPEIADATGLTHDSVRVNLHRGMKMLRKKLGVRN